MSSNNISLVDANLVFYLTLVEYSKQQKDQTIRRPQSATEIAFDIIQDLYGVVNPFNYNVASIGFNVFMAYKKSCNTFMPKGTEKPDDAHAKSQQELPLKTPAN